MTNSNTNQENDNVSEMNIGDLYQPCRNNSNQDQVVDPDRLIPFIPEIRYNTSPSQISNGWKNFHPKMWTLWRIYEVRENENGTPAKLANSSTIFKNKAEVQGFVNRAAEANPDRDIAMAHYDSYWGVCFIYFSKIESERNCSADPVSRNIDPIDENLTNGILRSYLNLPDDFNFKKSPILRTENFGKIKFNYKDLVTPAVTSSTVKLDVENHNPSDESKELNWGAWDALVRAKSEFGYPTNKDSNCPKMINVSNYTSSNQSTCAVIQEAAMRFKKNKKAADMVIWELSSALDYCRDSLKGIYPLNGRLRWHKWYQSDGYGADYKEYPIRRYPMYLNFDISQAVGGGISLRTNPNFFIDRNDALWFAHNNYYSPTDAVDELRIEPPYYFGIQMWYTPDTETPIKDIYTNNKYRNTCGTLERYKNYGYNAFDRAPSRIIHHPTAVLECAASEKHSLNMSSDVYFIGDDAYWGIMDSDSERQKEPFFRSLYGLVNFHQNKNNGKGTIVNCSWGVGERTVSFADYFVELGVMSELESPDVGRGKSIVVSYINPSTLQRTNRIVKYEELTMYFDGRVQRWRQSGFQPALQNFMNSIGIGGTLTSYSSAYYDNSIQTDQQPYNNRLENRALKYAADQGILFCIAAGNQGTPFYSSEDIRSKTFVCRTTGDANVNAATEKYFPAIKQLPYFELTQNEIDNNLSQKPVVVGGHLLDGDFSSNIDYMTTEVKGQYGSVCDLSASFGHRALGNIEDKANYFIIGTSFASPIACGILAGGTKKFGNSKLQKLLNKSTMVLSDADQNIFNTKSSATGGDINKPGLNGAMRNLLKAKGLKGDFSYTLTSIRGVYGKSRGVETKNTQSSNIYLNYPDLQSREQKSFNGFKRKKHGNLMRLNNRRGFDD